TLWRSKKRSSVARGCDRRRAAAPPVAAERRDGGASALRNCNRGDVKRRGERWFRAIERVAKRQPGRGKVGQQRAVSNDRAGHRNPVAEAPEKTVEARQLTLPQPIGELVPVSRHLAEPRIGVSNGSPAGVIRP